MVLIVILLILGFAATLSIVEIPKLLRTKSYKELCVFSLLLALGVVLSILKSLEVEIGNPSDLFAWIYSPLEDIMESLTKKG
ncbi:MAG: hypothetical protein PHH84_04525 [Oscillospiraceae bacterium]|nr:hypothetical protein [Oscillospiraceae bacterium]MDD4413672.1 hypothetical protein [Oscillospiraceae bacterium]